MKVDFVLVATGSALLPKINHALFVSYPEDAKIAAQTAVAALHKAGYFQFTLYDTRRENKNKTDVEIARFRVAEQEPHILME